MDETEFNALAESALARLEQALDGCEAELDYELQPGGVLEIAFADGSKIVVNRHAAAREIWVAARSGGFHFRPEGGRWIGTRDGAELFEVLSRLASAQAGARVELA
ncbi:MAG TPA: iron donor protein CyaY [Candidatus Desulfobacillus sp.]|nr:iron donor protein CyaY [Candidatus Desulfobacillus sp.]